MFQDLLDDWSAEGYPDLVYFVPYTWKFGFTLKQFELLSPTNEYNWVNFYFAIKLANEFK